MTECNSTDDLGMTLCFDEENELFILAFVVEGKSIFQVKMTPQTFDKLTSDMVRVVKDYNLEKAKQYLAKKEQQDGNAITDQSEKGEETSGQEAEGQAVQAELLGTEPEGNSEGTQEPDTRSCSNNLGCPA